jgi:hypothetical protein
MDFFGKSIPGSGLVGIGITKVNWGRGYVTLLYTIPSLPLF